MSQQHGSSATKTLTFRTHQPGEMGYITHRHAVLYAQDHGWGPAFEAMVSRITADFLDNFDARKERCWIAEQGDEFAGSVCLIADRTSTPDTARIRVLLVEPAARRLGLGRQLVQKCVDFARETGYRRVVLTTSPSQLAAAGGLYRGFGFRVVREEEEEELVFAPGSRAQIWELLLDGETD